MSANELFLGEGENALEVVTCEAESRPRAGDLRKLWLARQGRRASPLLLVASYPTGSGTETALCGPVGEQPPVLADIGVSQAERLAAAALSEPNRHAAIRFLTAMLPDIGADMAGLRNSGLLATQELRSGVPARVDWGEACQRSAPLLSSRGRTLVESLGFGIDQLSTSSSMLTVTRGGRRAVAVFLDEGETFEDPASRFGASPVSHALALADREGVPWVMLTRARQIRLYAAKADTGVGRKGRSETFVEVNLALLPEDRAGYLSLLFSSEALGEGGTLDEVLASSADFAADLAVRLRERVYVDVVPRLAEAIASRLDSHADLSDETLDQAYERTLTVLFRLLFLAYAEDKDLLPYHTNGRYADHSLKRIARRLAEDRQKGHVEFDRGAVDHWEDISQLWRAVDRGNSAWGVPGYNGGLFSVDPKVSPAGAALAALELSDAEFGPALSALLVDEGPDGLIGPVDFRSLSVREFGTIYEGLLESQLSVAPSDLTLDGRGQFVPAGRRADVEIPAGSIYFHNRSGARKATGSYFTKPFAVDHLLNESLEPALDDHLRRVKDLLDAGDQAAAADAFFDFRCVDLAMGSGHFLVASVDRIEARLSDFLALNPVPPVNSELEKLRQAAFAALGDLADGVEIETTSLLRRQVARRCVYGVDANRVSVELARLALWIHTFVPGLPLSFLDHSLVFGNSLTGIGTLDEALALLDPEAADTGARSLFADEIETFLSRAEDALRRLARTTEATVADVKVARAANEEAVAAVQPAKDLFDLLVAARLDEVAMPVTASEESIATNPQLPQARSVGNDLGAIHFPVAFPEVFLRERPGFDCIIGNPPWEEATVEELGFWALRFPGLKSLTSAEQKREIRAIRSERPDLVEEYEQAVDEAEYVRDALVAGPYPGMGTGDPDLYKAFAWRFWTLMREGGAVGVVLPRSALAAAGSGPWRKAVLAGGSFTDVTMMLNTRGWVFDDAEHRYTIGLVALRRGTKFSGTLRLRGPYASLAAFWQGVEEEPAEFTSDEFRTWSESAAFPLLPTPRSVTVFAQLRRHPRMDAAPGAGEGEFSRPRPVREFDATNDKHLFEMEEKRGRWPVFKGASFNLWEPDTGVRYAWAETSQIREALQFKRLRQQRLARSAFSGFSREWAADPETLPCLRPRIAFRDIARATDSRTVIAALVPPEIVITNQAPYLVWPGGVERDEAYLLGVLCSIPLDWCARRTVETHLNFHVFNALPIPRPARDADLRRRVEQVAGRLAARDDRYEQWADAVGVDFGPVESADKVQMVAELDALVALLYELDEDDLTHIFETFHAGWDYTERLDLVLEHFRAHA